MSKNTEDTTPQSLFAKLRARVSEFVAHIEALSTIALEMLDKQNKTSITSPLKKQEEQLLIAMAEILKRTIDIIIMNRNWITKLETVTSELYYEWLQTLLSLLRKAEFDRALIDYLTKEAESIKALQTFYLMFNTNVISKIIDKCAMMLSNIKDGTTNQLTRLRGFLEEINSMIESEYEQFKILGKQVCQQVIENRFPLINTDSYDLQRLHSDLLTSYEQVDKREKTPKQMLAESRNLLYNAMHVHVREKHTESDLNKILVEHSEQLHRLDSPKADSIAELNILKDGTIKIEEEAEASLVTINALDGQIKSIQKGLPEQQRLHEKGNLSAKDAYQTTSNVEGAEATTINIGASMKARESSISNFENLFKQLKIKFDQKIDSRETTKNQERTYPSLTTEKDQKPIIGVAIPDMKQTIAHKQESNSVQEPTTPINVTNGDDKVLSHSKEKADIQSVPISDSSHQPSIEPAEEISEDTLLEMFEMTIKQKPDGNLQPSTHAPKEPGQSAPHTLETEIKDPKENKISVEQQSPKPASLTTGTESASQVNTENKLNGVTEGKQHDKSPSNGKPQGIPLGRDLRIWGQDPGKKSASGSSGTEPDKETKPKIDPKDKPKKGNDDEAGSEHRSRLRP